MQPLNLEQDKYWRVVKADVIQLNLNKKYYTLNVIFQEINLIDEQLKKWKSNKHEVRSLNFSQIKYFPIGSIWQNDKLVKNPDYFELFSIDNSKEFFADTKNVTFNEDGSYFDQFHLPYSLMNDNVVNLSSSTVIYESDTFYKINLNGKIFSTKFIAFPCFEIARYFLLSIGTYNGLLLTSDLMDENNNNLFFNSETKSLKNEYGDNTIHLKLKYKVPYARYLNVADLASSNLYRREAAKLLQFNIHTENHFSGIQLPIEKFTKLSFYAKRVKRSSDKEFGLYVPTIASCFGHRNYENVIVDHEDENKKRINEKNDNPNNPEEENNDTNFKTINTGNPEEYNDDDFTNNNLSPIIEKESDLMSLLSQDSENIPFEKITTGSISNNPKNNIINEVEATKKALMTDISNDSGNTQPIIFGEKTIYNQNEMRDESDSSYIYQTRYFQDFTKIIDLLKTKLEKEFGSRAIEIKTSDKNILFDTNVKNFELRFFNRGHNPNFFLKSNTKQQRKVYLIEIKIHNKYFYLVETEFRSDKSTNSTIVFTRKNYAECIKDNIFTFFGNYIICNGVVRRMNLKLEITDLFTVHYIEHPIQVPKVRTYYTVKDAFEKFTNTILKKIKLE